MHSAATRLARRYSCNCVQSPLVALLQTFYTESMCGICTKALTFASEDVWVVFQHQLSAAMYKAVFKVNNCVTFNKSNLRTRLVLSSALQLMY